MRKLLNILIAATLTLGLAVPAMAVNETTITYTGTGKESYTITVPSVLKPGESGTVTAEGTWASNRVLSVKTASTVTLVNDLDNSEKTLNISFDGISKYGNNQSTISISQPISISEFSGEALFGTWTGIFNYTVSMKDTQLKFYGDSRCDTEKGNPVVHSCGVCGGILIQDNHGEIDTSDFDKALAEANEIAANSGGKYTVSSTYDTLDHTTPGNDGSAGCSGSDHNRCGGGHCGGHGSGDNYYTDGCDSAGWDGNSHIAGTKCNGNHKWEIKLVPA